MEQAIGRSGNQPVEADGGTEREKPTTPSESRARMVEWLQQQEGWVPAYRLWEWARSTLGLSKGQVSGDFNYIVRDGRAERRFIDPEIVRTTPKRHHGSCSVWAEARATPSGTAKIST